MKRKVVMAFIAFAAAAALSGPAALAQSAGDSQQYGDDVYGSAGPGAAQQPAASEPAANDSATLAKRAPTQTVLRANLTGEVEVPPGNPEATGSTELKVTEGQVCWTVSWTGVSPTASHIHKGAAGAAGPIVVPFFKSASALGGKSKSGCTEVSAELAKGIAGNPANYYVNVHDSQYPKGAIRGQLASAGADVAGQLPNTGSFRSRGLMLLGLSIVAAGSLLLAVGQRRRRPSHARR